MTSFWAVSPPPTVLLPSERVQEGDAEARIVLRQVGDELVVTAYSSLSTLVRCCGEEQPWVAMPAGDVELLKQSVGAIVVLLDLPVLDLPQVDRPAADASSKSRASRL